MGAALDYAIRFTLSRRGYGVLGPLVAGKGLLAEGAPPFRCPLIVQTLRRVHERCVRAVRGWPGATLGDAEAEACLRLAELDVVHRAGLRNYRHGPTGPAEWDELRALWDIVPWDDFEGFSWTVLNPTFGRGSRLVGGADGDLLVDDVLVDFKCSAQTGLSARDVRQVAGYAVLANRFGVDGLDEDAWAQWPGDRVVTHVGLYLARAGVLRVFPLEDVISRTHQDELLAFLVGPADARRAGDP